MANIAVIGTGYVGLTTGAYLAHLGHEVAQAALAEAGLDPARVTPITTAEHPSPARRPAYSVLDNAALRLQGLPLLPDWRESLGRLVKELTS